MKFIKISAFAIVLLLLMQIASKAFIAIDSSDIENIYGIYAEPENSLDMVMIGPSEVYTGYAPALAWEEYGLKSCNLSIGAVPCNMYKSIVTEIVKRQRPKLLVINASAFSQGNWNLTDEVYLRKWIDNMPMSQNKLDTVETIPKNINKDDEEVKDNISDTLYFPLEKYHGNWKDPEAVYTSFVTRAYMRLSGGGYLKGFYSKTGITGGRDNLANIGQPTKEAYVLTDECRAYLKELLSYCNKLGIEHVLLLQPPHETQAADKSGLEQIESITKAYGYDFLDLSTDYESIAGIDDSHDFADFEHLNAYGAKKLTAYIGNMAVNQYGIKSDTAKSELSIWKKSVKRTKKALKMAREYTDRGEAQVVGEYEAAK